MGKKVFYGEDARKRVLLGAETLYNAVKTTMGPKGRNVVIGKFGSPTVTHDGVTVAKGVEIADVDDETLGSRIGAELIKEAASKMEKIGDGTTTVTVLTYHILNEANKLIAAGHNPMELRSGLETALAWVKAQLDSIAVKVDENPLKMAEVASISAGDPELGKLIAEVFEKIGKDGTVTVDEGNGLDTTSEIVSGFTVDSGFVSPYMVTDKQKSESIQNKPAILLTSDKVTTVQDILPLIEALASNGQKELLIVADDFGAEVVNTFVINRVRGAFNITAIKAPSFGDKQEELLNDLAVIVGAKVLSSNKGQPLSGVTIELLGTADKVISTRESTTIVNGDTDSAVLKERVAELEGKTKLSKNDFDKVTLQNRISALSGRVAVIKVGGATDTEINEKKYRVDDAVAAVKAALQEGIVPGGGVALFNIANAADTNNVGFTLLLDAIEKPLHIILENAGLPAEHLVEVIRESKPGCGINVMDIEHGTVDMVKAGVIDPVVVTKEALTNAVSIAGTAMTMGALVVDVPQVVTMQNGV
jgi:chaperonin GroEL